MIGFGKGKIILKFPPFFNLKKGGNFKIFFLFRTLSYTILLLPSLAKDVSRVFIDGTTNVAGFCFENLPRTGDTENL